MFFTTVIEMSTTVERQTISRPKSKIYMGKDLVKSSK